MAKEEKKAPKLRFNGYTNDWERKELNNILKINSGRDYKQLNSGNIPVYGTGGYMLSVNDKLSDTDAVGIGRKGTIDKPLYLKAPFWTVDTLFYCTSKENSDVKFIYLLFQIINWKRYDESTGVPSLSKNTISNIKTYVPKIEEQDYISKLFFSLDNTLQLHERKYEELTIIKQALLQKLFPKKDEIKPEVRYENFSDAWEQRKLVSLFSKFTDGDWIESKDQANTGIRLIQTGNIGITEFINKFGNEKWISEETFKKLNCEEIFPGDIIISRLPDPAGRACILPKLDTRMITAVDCTIARTSRETSAEFIVQYLSTQTYFKYVQSCLAGGTRQRISRKNLANFNVSIPTEINEQKQIGFFFKQLDTLIALHQCKLEKLKQLKKFLLQNMFI